jgi:hydrogenase expression/formation protein HypC
MCVGVPMTVIGVGAHEAICEVDGERRTISTLLIRGEIRVGDHLLTHAGAAVRVIDAEEARLIADALRAVMAAAQGRPFDHLIADLIDREPPLPDHLRDRAAASVPAGGTRP